MIIFRMSVLAMFVALLLLVAGCGDDRNAATVSGKVTVNGQPLADIGVTFQPEDAAGLGSIGKTDASGNYTLRFSDNDREGALVGKHRVTFYDHQDGIEGESPDAGPAPIPKTRLPPNYVTGAESYEVKPGKNQADFDLK